MKAIIKGAHIADCRNLMSRHATPKEFCHILLFGVKGRAALKAIDPNASGIFIFKHPTLGDWSSVPNNFKQANGSPMLAWLGITQLPVPDPVSAEEFAQETFIEMYVLGHINKYINGTARDGSDFLAISITSATLLNSIDPQYIVWQTGDNWNAVNAKYKNSQRQPLIDPDEAVNVEIVMPPG